MSKLQAYYQLVKPGVMYGNVLTGVAGYLFAAGHFGIFSWGNFAATIFGMTLVVSAACVLNNYLDQDIDQIMKRTKKRPSVTGEVSGRAMVLYSITLFALGTLMLALWTNWLVVAIGVLGFVIYVWLYGALSKRKSLHGTLVGSISGAMPIAGGYAAVSGTIDTGLILVFLILFFWQFPEFYSISIYRRKEYKAAGIPVISVVGECRRQCAGFLSIRFFMSYVRLRSRRSGIRAGYTLSSCYWRDSTGSTRAIKASRPKIQTIGHVNECFDKQCITYSSFVSC